LPPHASLKNAQSVFARSGSFVEKFGGDGKIHRPDADDVRPWRRPVSRARSSIVPELDAQQSKQISVQDKPLRHEGRRLASASPDSRTARSGSTSANLSARGRLDKQSSSSYGIVLSLPAV
jgi:hypothetical protein